MLASGWNLLAPPCVFLHDVDFRQPVFDKLSICPLHKSAIRILFGMLDFHDEDTPIGKGFVVMGGSPNVVDVQLPNGIGFLDARQKPRIRLVIRWKRSFSICRSMSGLSERGNQCILHHTDDHAQLYD